MEAVTFIFSEMVKPFLRWVGGKRWLWNIISPEINRVFHDRYIEPFLGGGSIAISYMEDLDKRGDHKKFILGDANAKLVNTYEQIKNNVNDVISELESIINSKPDYYAVRTEFNKTREMNSRLAALFIWLNKHSFRGVYRENKYGEFSTPRGLPIKQVYDEDNLRELSRLFQKYAEFRVARFNEYKEDGLYYLDPPYVNTYDGYTTLGAVTSGDLNQFMESKPESTFLVSNNAEYNAPAHAMIITHKVIDERMDPRANRNKSRHEYLYKVD